MQDDEIRTSVIVKRNDMPRIKDMARIKKTHVRDYMGAAVMKALEADERKTQKKEG